LAPYAAGWAKAYEGVIRLGRTTSTDDATGHTTAISDAWQSLDETRVEAVLARFRGAYQQQPPAYSAVKVAGERAYRRARRGEAAGGGRGRAGRGDARAAGACGEGGRGKGGAVRGRPSGCGGRTRGGAAEAASRGGGRMMDTVATVGTFDGVHRGHQGVLAEIVQRARTRGLASLIVTFDRHPLEIVNPPAAPRLLTLPDEKRALLAQLGLDRTGPLPFTAELARLARSDERR